MGSTAIAPPASAQLSLPGVAHLDAQSVVVSVFPDSLQGVQFYATVQHKRKRVQFSTRFDPAAMERWVAAMADFVESGGGTTPVAPVLSGLGGHSGLSLQRPAKKRGGEIYWLLHRSEESEPLVIRADPQFTDTLLASLWEAAKLSAIDSSAFANGLVAPLTDIPDSLCPWPISVPSPVYPSRLASAGVDGLVQVRFVIEADSTVAEHTIEVSWASAPEFIPPVKQALVRGRYRPARWNGRPVRALVYQDVRFGVHGGRRRWN